MSINKYAGSIANEMDQILRSEEYQTLFSYSDKIKKLAFTRVSDENKPTEVEIEFAKELSTQPLEEMPEEIKTASNPRGDCVACGKTRGGWTEEMGVCHCPATSGCSPMGGCKDGCSCGCKAKKAEVIMETLIKSAVDALLKASSDLEDAGFEKLAGDTLILTNELIVEAKAKKNKKELKAKERAEKEKAKLKLEKERAKVEKDKNDAKDKTMKEKERAAKKKKEEAEKAKAKK